MAKDNRHKLSNFYIRHMAKGLARQRYGACIGAMAVLFGVALALGQLRGYYAQGATDSLRSLITGLLIAFLSLIVTAPANVGARGVFCDIAAQRETRATKALAWYGDGKRLSSSILLMLAQTLIVLAALTLFGGLALAVTELIRCFSPRCSAATCFSCCCPFINFIFCCWQSLGRRI